ncbi:MAG TPA: GNAT family N-acetyltransferase, partial [Thermomicrobiales bacterium]|nr:GNAT family N-acetyltransferase [Thermomicrobiales bacterium]
MQCMIKRWLRRRLDFHMSDLETSLDENDRERGTLVRKGALISLRTHVPANREAFQRWYADPEIAELLRHDLEPLTLTQSRGYFDTFILPSSARGTCFAIHERSTKRLIGTTALTDRVSRPDGVSALFRIVIGEKDAWGRGYGTEATRLVADEAFDRMGLGEIRLEVFSHNSRAISAYTRVGFEITGEHVEWVPRRKTEL